LWSKLIFPTVSAHIRAVHRQENDEERELIKRAKPDILLTNFMMLELLMTRQSERDQTVIGNAEGLDFLYSMSSTRIEGVRAQTSLCWCVASVNRLCRNKQPICIGNVCHDGDEGEETARATAVAKVATRPYPCQPGCCSRMVMGASAG